MNSRNTCHLSDHFSKSKTRLDFKDVLWKITVPSCKKANTLGWLDFYNFLRQRVVKRKVKHSNLTGFGSFPQATH